MDAMCRIDLQLQRLRKLVFERVLRTLVCGEHSRVYLRARSALLSTPASVLASIFRGVMRLRQVPTASEVVA